MPEVASFEFLSYPSRPHALEEIDRLVNPDVAPPHQATGALLPLDQDLEPIPEESFDRVVELLLRHGKDRPGQDDRREGGFRRGPLKPRRAVARRRRVGPDVALSAA
jgi:hypothetical protein